ncbi:MAG: alpha/beta fold hydrolase [Candidatus Thorarchaeota archaeon]|jgi:pimeloyl-ACP methyl ester carboxylesterase
MPFAQTGNIKTYYETHGQGPPLVFIHGAGGSHDNWKPQVEYFSNTYLVVTYDVRGHQQSEGSDDEYRCSLFANDLHLLIEHLEIREPVVCGLSLGGMIAQEYAIKHPDNLRGLVLCDTAISSAMTLSDKITKAMYPERLVKWTLRRMSPESYAEWSFKFFDMKDEVKEYLIGEQLKIPQEEMLKIIGTAYNFKQLPLETVKVPTLVMLGENERKAVFPHADKMVELIPNSRKIIVPDAGHVSNLENPDFFNQELDDFLRSLVKSTIDGF